MTVKLNHGFFIEIDALNYTLCRKYKGKARDGREKDAVKTCGYFGNIESAVKEYLRLVQLENLKDETLSSEKFLLAIDKSNEVAVEKIIKRIGESEKKLSNGDRIRGMGDEELAKFLSEFSACNICEQFDKRLDRCGADNHFVCVKEYAQAIIGDWLKQPVED